MNKQKNSILINDTADVGIGTLIIFIAMVLVAAVAAAVLIQTSGILQQKAQQTGKEAATEVTSNVNIVSIIGNIGTSQKIDNFTIAIQLSAGGQNIDFQSVVMKYIDNQTSDTMNYANINYTSLVGNHTAYNYSEQRFVGSSANKVLSSGELGIITIAPTNPLGLREKGLIEIVPESGTMIMKEVLAPSTWGTKGFIQLFP
jgi:flagellin FlaB